MNEKRFNVDKIMDFFMTVNMIGVCLLSWAVLLFVLLTMLGVIR